jgi:hypothetical protein
LPEDSTPWDPKQQPAASQQDFKLHIESEESSSEEHFRNTLPKTATLKRREALGQPVLLKIHSAQEQRAEGEGKLGRKEKSLGELCRKFLSIYGKEEKDLLLLDQCTSELGVERRRIYDIINILESFSVIKREAKNSYKWRGISRILESI